MGWNRPTLGIFLLAALALACTAKELTRGGVASVDERDAAAPAEPTAADTVTGRARPRLEPHTIDGGSSTAMYGLAPAPETPDWSTERYDFVAEEGFLSPAARASRPTA